MAHAKGSLRSNIAAVFARPDWFSRINAASLRADLFAGLTGATLVLPQGVAFAAIAGLPPEYGFYTAMITTIVAAVLGSSWHAVSGPTTAISALVFGALSGQYSPGSPEFISAAVVLALLVGAMQLMLGLARLGNLVDFVSHSVMTGFVTGAAILIVLSQIGAGLGLSLPRPEHLDTFLYSLYSQIPDTNINTFLIAVTAVTVGIGVKQWRPSWPNYLIALAVATGLSVLLGADTAGISTIGAINSVTPSFAMPQVTLANVQGLSTAAMAIALVGLLEAMAVSRAIALRSGQMIDGNREFIGQGASNLIGSFFQCYPGSASFTRSGVNYDAGAATPISAIFASNILFLILQLVAAWFAYVPVAALAGVIILVAVRLINIK